MKKSVLWVWLMVWTGVAMAADQELQGGVNPGYHEPPAWFKASFLDLREDVAEAAASGRQVLLYFYQDGCPYCKKLLDDNFGQAAITAKTRRLYDVVAINIWGDREVTALNGHAMTEKQLAEQLKVMYTPTLLFLDPAGEVRLRLNGYYAPARFELALDYGARREADGLSFRDYLARHLPVVSGALQSESFFLRPPYALARNRIAAQRPLLVLFEQPGCSGCDELHRDILSRPQTRALMQGLDVVQLDMWAQTPLVTPDGVKGTAAAWAQRLGVHQAPSLVFFDEQGREVFRADAYLRAFHIQSVIDYVASGAYKRQPNLQRFIQERAEHLREQGITVDLME